MNIKNQNNKNEEWITIQLFKASGKWCHDESFDIKGLEDFEIGCEISKRIFKGMYGYGTTRNGVPFLVIGKEE